MNAQMTHAHANPNVASTALDYVFILLAIVLGAGSVVLLIVGEKMGLTFRFIGWSDIADKHHQIQKLDLVLRAK